MGIVIFRRRRYILLGAATSVAAASAIRRLTATCGLVLLTQVLSRTTCFTILALSTQPTAITVSTDSQSAVSPAIAGSSDFGYLLVKQGITSSFGTAGENTGLNSNEYSNIQKSPLYIPRGGFFYDTTNGGDFGGQASQGDLWSNTTISGTHAYYLEYRSAFISSALNYDRYYGFPVHCIAR